MRSIREWKQWRRDLLPMLPREWPLVVYEKTKDQFETVKRILNFAESVARRVRHGRGPRRRADLPLHLRSRAVRQAGEPPVDLFAHAGRDPAGLRRAAARRRITTALADAARGRSRADWLVGMNLSRAYSLTYGEDLSVGRVQTPTLAMLVERELAIRRFVPEDYMEVAGDLPPARARRRTRRTRARGCAIAEPPARTRNRCSRRCGCRPTAKRPAQIAARARTGQAAIESIEAQTQRMPPPLLYDLTELQRHANRLFGFSAQKTLDTAQALYERHKLISYPRTDSRHLSQDVAQTLPRVVAAIAAPYREHLAPGTGERPLGRRLRGRCEGHRPPRDHPHRDSRRTRRLPPDERKIYDLICRRLLSAWHEDHIWSVTTVITAIRNDADRRPLSHVRQRGAAGGLEGAGPRAGEGAKGAEGRGAAAKRRCCRPDWRRGSRRTWWMSRC